MKFEIIGPFEVAFENIIKQDNIKQLRALIGLGTSEAALLGAPGCYIFAIKPSGSRRYIPWYVGKSEKQSIFLEATNKSHLQIYNEILDGKTKAKVGLYFVPAITQNKKPRKISKAKLGDARIAFLEEWLIATALKANKDLWNIKSTTMLRNLSVRGLLNPTPGDMNKAAGSLKKCLCINN